MASDSYILTSPIKKALTITSYSTTSGATTTSRTDSVSGTIQYVNKSRSWVRTPNYRALMKAGTHLPDNSFTYSNRRLTAAMGYYDSGIIPGGFGWQRRSCTYGPYVAVGYYLPANILTLSQVNSRLIAKMKGQQWNVSVFLAEGHKTANMVVQRATHIAGLVDRLRRGDVVGFFNQLHHSVIKPGRRAVRRFNKDYGQSAAKASSDAWLEYSYGWRPFMKDVQDAVNTLLDVGDKPAAHDMTVGASVHTDYRADLLALQNVFVDSECTIRGQYYREAKESLRATWRFRPTPLDLPARFGLVNPMEVVWELLPFSFVADWFLPIGNYLSALDVPLRVTHLGGVYGRRLQTKMTTIARTGPSGVQTWSGFTGHGDSVDITRTPMTVIPSIALSSLTVNNGLDPLNKGAGARVMSAISLLNQQLLRLGR